MTINPFITGLEEDFVLDGNELIEVRGPDGVRRAMPVSLLGQGGGTVEQLPPLYRGQQATASRIANFFNSANKQSMGSSRHIKRGTGKTMQLLYWNGSCSSGGSIETGRGGTATYSASIEYPVGSAPRPFTWSGGAPFRDAADNELILTDEMPFDVPDGAAFWIHCYQTSTIGVCMSVFPGTKQGGVNEGTEFGASGVANATGTAQGATTKNTDYGTPPLAILGMTRRPALGLFGDSRTAGAQDVGDLTTNTGLIARTIGRSLAYINLGVPGDKLVNLKTTNAIRFSLLQYLTGATLCMGINDHKGSGTTGAVMYADTQSIVSQMLAIKPNLKIAVGTVEPWASASSDSYGTGSGQTVPASDVTGRAALNDLLRKRGIVGSSATWDIADVLESSRNSGQWKGGLNTAPNPVNYPLTGDGLHANQLGNLLVEQSGVVNLAMFARS